MNVSYETVVLFKNIELNPFSNYSVRNSLIYKVTKCPWKEEKQRKKKKASNGSKPKQPNRLQINYVKDLESEKFKTKPTKKEVTTFETKTKPQFKNEKQK